MRVEVVEFAGAWLPLPPDQRTRLSVNGAWCRLGVDAAAGVRAWDPQARIILRIGPLDLKGFQRLLPDRVALHRLVSLVRAYVGFELGFAINPVLAAREVPPLRLDATVGSAAAAGLEHLGPRRRPGGFTARADAADAVFEAEVIEAQQVDWRGKGEGGMSGWGSGYVTDITYMTGYYRQQSPSMIALALPAGRRRLADAAAGRSGELSGAWLRPGLRRDGPGGEQSALDGHRDRLQSGAYRGGARLGGAGRARQRQLPRGRSVRRWPRTRVAAQVPEADFVSMHGVWSWVPPAVQSGIVRLLRAKVKPGGAVHVSYNALPAWGGALGMQRVMRECGRRLGSRSDRQAEEGLKLVKELHAADALQLIRSPWVNCADRADGHAAGAVSGARVHERQLGRRASTPTWPRRSPTPSSSGSARSAWSRISPNSRSPTNSAR